MSNKSESKNENRGRWSMRNQARKASREEGAGHMGGSQQQIREENSGEASGYQQKIRGKKLAEGNKKSGCFPKLFMLLLPFMALGTYLLLRS